RLGTCPPPSLLRAQPAASLRHNPDATPTRHRDNPARTRTFPARTGARSPEIGQIGETAQSAAGRPVGRCEVAMATTPPADPQTSAVSERRPATTLALATAGFTICFLAWALLGPVGSVFADARGVLHIPESYIL